MPKRTYGHDSSGKPIKGADLELMKAVAIPSAAVIRDLLKARRKAAGITQAQLAAELGRPWTQSTIAAKENGARGIWIHELDQWVAALVRLGGVIVDAKTYLWDSGDPAAVDNAIDASTDLEQLAKELTDEASDCGIVLNVADVLAELIGRANE